MVTGFLDTAPDDVATVSQPTGGETKLPAQLGQVGAAQVPEFDPLEVSPDALVRVEIWGVAWKALQVDAPSSAARQVVLDDLGPVNGRAIPDDRERSRDMKQQVIEEPNDVLTLVGPVLDTQVQVAARGDGADGREVIPCEWHLEDGGLTPGGVGPHHRGQEVEAALVYPEDGPAFLLGLFLTSGHRSLIHSWMASSLRWAARLVGFWLLQPACLRRCLA